MCLVFVKQGTLSHMGPTACDRGGRAVMTFTCLFVFCWETLYQVPYHVLCLNVAFSCVTLYYNRPKGSRVLQTHGNH